MRQSVVRFTVFILVLAACSAPVVTGSTSGFSTVSTAPSVGPTTTSLPAHTTTAARPTTSSNEPSTTLGGVLAGAVIVLDPGHNGMNWAHPEEIGQTVDIGTGTKACNTVGASTDDGYPEAQFTWEVATRARSAIEALGASVTLTRTDNDGWGPCITERAAIGNELGADAVISIHADGGPAEGRGFHVIHPAPVSRLTDDIAAESLRLAHALHTEYLETGMPMADYIADGGYSERSDLGGLTLSDVPVVFLEAGNMRNAEDAALLSDPDFQGRIADAITAALVAFLRP